MIAFRMMDEDEDFLFAGNLVIVPCLELAIVKAERVLRRKVNAWEVATGRTRHDRDLPDTSWVRSTWVFARD